MPFFKIKGEIKLWDCIFPIHLKVFQPYLYWSPHLLEIIYSLFRNIVSPYRLKNYYYSGVSLLFRPHVTVPDFKLQINVHICVRFVCSQTNSGDVNHCDCSENGDSAQRLQEPWSQGRWRSALWGMEACDVPGVCGFYMQVCGDSVIPVWALQMSRGKKKGLIYSSIKGGT